jgi:hypothetical protein
MTLANKRQADIRRTAEVLAGMRRLRRSDSATVRRLVTRYRASWPKLVKLCRMLERATDSDYGWYDQTDATLAELFGAHWPIVGKFLAVTSANATVQANAVLALKAFRQWQAGEAFKGYLPTVKAQLDQIVKGEAFGGRKVGNFARALSGDTHAVVVDRWIVRVFGLDSDHPTDLQYSLIEETILILSDRIGRTPRQIQAGLWFVQRADAVANGHRNDDASPLETALRSAIARGQQSRLPFGG